MPEPQLGSDYVRHTLDLMQSNGINDRCAEAVVASVIAGKLKPESALPFAKLINGSTQPDADKSIHGHVVDVWLDNEIYSGFRASPTATANPSSAEPPPSQWNALYGGVGVKPPTATANAQPGSVADIANNWRANQAAQHQQMDDKMAAIHQRHAAHNAAAHGGHSGADDLARFIVRNQSIESTFVGLNPQTKGNKK